MLRSQDSPPSLEPLMPDAMTLRQGSLISLSKTNSWPRPLLSSTSSSTQNATELLDWPLAFRPWRLVAKTSRTVSDIWPRRTNFYARLWMISIISWASPELTTNVSQSWWPTRRIHSDWSKMRTRDSENASLSNRNRWTACTMCNRKTPCFNLSSRPRQMPCKFRSNSSTTSELLKLSRISSTPNSWQWSVRSNRPRTIDWPRLHHHNLGTISSPTSTTAHCQPSIALVTHRLGPVKMSVLSSLEWAMDKLQVGIKRPQLHKRTDQGFYKCIQKIVSIYKMCDLLSIKESIIIFIFWGSSFN